MKKSSLCLWLMTLGGRESDIPCFDRTVNLNTLPQARVHGRKCSKGSKKQKSILKPWRKHCLPHVAKFFNFWLTSVKITPTVEYNPLENSLWSKNCTSSIVGQQWPRWKSLYLVQGRGQITTASCIKEGIPVSALDSRIMTGLNL